MVMAKIIDGKKLAQAKEAELKKKLSKWIKEKQTKPLLVSLVAEEDNLGQLYTRLKREAINRIGGEFKRLQFSLKDPNQAVIMAETVRQNQKLKGLIIQKPGQEVTRQYFKTKEEFKAWWLRMVEKIPVAVDIDGLNPATLGQMVVGRCWFYPATVKAVYSALLTVYKEKNLAGKQAVIAGSSEILGKPLALLLRDKGMTVSMFGSSEKDVVDLCNQADVVIGCVGIPGLIKGEMVKNGAVVIDAGMSQVKGKPVGDVDFDSVVKKAGFITPVPGGIGPMTVVSLLENLVEGLSRES